MNNQQIPNVNCSNNLFYNKSSIQDFIAFISRLKLKKKKKKKKKNINSSMAWNLQGDSLEFLRFFLPDCFMSFSLFNNTLNSFISFWINFIA